MSELKSKLLSKITYPEFWEILPFEILNIVFSKAENMLNYKNLDDLLINWFGNDLPLIIQNAQILLWIDRNNNITNYYGNLNSQNQYDLLFELICNQNNEINLNYMAQSLPEELKAIFIKAIHSISYLINQDKDNTNYSFIFN